MLVIMSVNLGIYGQTIAVILNQRINDNYGSKSNYSHLASGLCCGLSSLCSWITISIDGDVGVRALGQTDKILLI